jgi:hypothetical protein
MTTKNRPLKRKEPPRTGEENSKLSWSIQIAEKALTGEVQNRNVVPLRGGRTKARPGSPRVMKIAFDLALSSGSRKKPCRPTVLDCVFDFTAVFVNSLDIYSVQS